MMVCRWIFGVSTHKRHVEKNLPTPYLGYSDGCSFGCICVTLPLFQNVTSRSWVLWRFFSASKHPISNIGGKAVCAVKDWPCQIFLSGQSSARVPHLVHNAAIVIHNERCQLRWVLFWFRVPMQTKCTQIFLQRKCLQPGNKSSVDAKGGSLELACKQPRNIRAKILVVGYAISLRKLLAGLVRGALPCAHTLLRIFLQIYTNGPWTCRKYPAVQHCISLPHKVYSVLQY